MQTAIPAVLSLSKLKQNVAGINATACRFIRRWTFEWMRATKQRITAVDRRKKTLDREPCVRLSGNIGGSSDPPRHLSNCVHAHVCEATRTNSSLQAQRLTSAG